MMAQPDQPTWKGRIIALLIGALLLIAAAEGILRVAMPHWTEFFNGRFMRIITVPGYGDLATGRPGFDGYFAQNNGDFRARITINEFGLRHPDPVEAADGRIWIIGDSMAFGWGVEQNEVYSSVVAETMGVPTYNIASPGTNVCGYQAMIARMPSQLRPRAVVLGLILENDIAPYDCRASARAADEAAMTERVPEKSPLSMTYIKVTLMRISALYNFFAVSLKRVDLINNFLISIGLVAKEHAYKRNYSSEGYKIGVERTADEIVKVRGMLPQDIPFAVFIAPARFEIRDDDPVFRRLRTSMIAKLEKRGIRTIDPIAEFRAAGFASTHFAHDGHWSPAGHRIAGEVISRWLKDAPGF